MFSYTRAAFGLSSNGEPEKTGAAATVSQLFWTAWEAAQRASDRSRLAGLPRRYLDDIDMTPAELDEEVGPVDGLETQTTLVNSV